MRECRLERWEPPAAGYTGSFHVHLQPYRKHDHAPEYRCSGVTRHGSDVLADNACPREERQQLAGRHEHENALTDQQTLFYMEQDWNDAWKKRDVAWVEKNYAPFSRDVSAVTGLLQRKEESVAEMRNSKDTYESLELSDLNFRVEGDAAVVTGINTVKGKDSRGKPFDRKSRFTDTFIRRDGQWQVWATQGTLIK